tara:strand:- start:1371 stop:2015 length:645 start_codon:yes stop_codon:yes gene_type:complete
MFALIISIFMVGVQALNKQYIKNCLEIANPYTTISTSENLLRKTELCLSRVYIAFPESYRQQMSEKIEECVSDLKETEKSKSEYHAIQKSIGEITSNVGSSIVDSQQSIEKLIVCSQPLQRITNIDIYEEARFDTVTAAFIENMQTADACIHKSIDIISEQADDVQRQLNTYNEQYAKWLEMTEQRQKNAQECQQQIKSLAEEIFKHIVRESKF